MNSNKRIAATPCIKEMMMMMMIMIIIIINLNSDTPFNYWFFFVCPLLTLHNLSPTSVITNLHNFLSLSCSFLSVAT